VEVPELVPLPVLVPDPLVVPEPVVVPLPVFPVAVTSDAVEVADSSAPAMGWMSTERSRRPSRISSG